MVRGVLVRVAVAYDSTYEDDDDGWSVVGDDGRNSFGAEPVGRTDVASLGALGRFQLAHWWRRLMKTSLGMSSLIVLVTIRSFALSSGRSAGCGNRSDVRKKEGHQQRGKTAAARKRTAATNVVVQRINRDATVTSVKQSHQVKK